MRRFGYLLALALILSVTLLAGCGGKSGSGSEVQVTMNNMAYSPRELKISAGTTVTWLNKDVIDHAVSHGDPNKPGEKKLFNSGDFAAGKSFSHTFDKAGTYQVYCSTPGHASAGMVMTVVVGN